MWRKINVRVSATWDRGGLRTRFKLHFGGNDERNPTVWLLPVLRCYPGQLPSGCVLLTTCPQLRCEVWTQMFVEMMDLDVELCGLLSNLRFVLRGEVGVRRYNCVKKINRELWFSSIRTAWQRGGGVRCGGGRSIGEYIPWLWAKWEREGCTLRWVGLCGWCGFLLIEKSWWFCDTRDHSPGSRWVARMRVGLLESPWCWLHLASAGVGFGQGGRKMHRFLWRRVVKKSTLIEENGGFDKKSMCEWVPFELQVTYGRDSNCMLVEMTTGIQRYDFCQCCDASRASCHPDVYFFPCVLNWDVRCGVKSRCKRVFLNQNHHVS